MKLLSLHDFPYLLKSGMTVYLAGTSGEPIAVLDYLRSLPSAMSGVNFLTTFVSGINDFDLLDLNREAIATVFFMQPHLAPYRGTQRLRYVPQTYFGIDGYLRRLLTLDLAIIQVGRADRAGDCTLGPCVDFARVAFERAQIRVALVNRAVPHLPRSPRIPLSAFDYVIETVTPLRELKQPSPDPLSLRIAAQVATLIRDGDTIQTGIGKIPAQVLNALTAKRRLRIHSGVILEPVRTLQEHGALDGDFPLVAPVALGDAEFYRWVEGRSDIHLQDVAHTHCPGVLAQLEQFVSVNSAVEVDTMGQVNSESAGSIAISGPGGLPDFAYMASRSSNGRSIIALPSTDAKGHRSRIVPYMRAGNAIALGRTDVDFVVTEYGIAELKDKTTTERQREIIRICHPNFRADLEKALH